MLKNVSAVMISWASCMMTGLTTGAVQGMRESHSQHGQGLLLALIVSIRSTASITVHLPQQRGSSSEAHRQKWLLEVGVQPGGSPQQGLRRSVKEIFQGLQPTQGESRPYIWQKGALQTAQKSQPKVACTASPGQVA